MSLPSYPHFTLAEVAPGVYAAHAGDTGACISNAAVVDLEDKTVVVDTFMTVQAATDLRAAAEALTGRSASLVVTSHWHDDHHGGNQVFDDAEIVSTRRTVEIMAGQAPKDLDAYTAEIDAWLAQAREMTDADDEPTRRRGESALKTATLLREAAPGFRFTPPNPIDGDGMTLEGAERRVEVMTFGGGHTESDVFVHVPDVDVVVAGDLLWVENHPRADDGNPAAWADILDQITGLGPLAVVPGHGPTGDAGHLAQLAAYLRTLDAMVSDAITSGLPDEAITAIPVPAGSERWASEARFAGSLAALVAARRG
jgi:glyoxylase-like metal-dependent hydrolase (beta-lactamase superfamily II)